MDLAQVLLVALVNLNNLNNHNNLSHQPEVDCLVRLNQVNQPEVVDYSAKPTTNNNKAVLVSAVDLVVAVSASKTNLLLQASVVDLDLQTQPALVPALVLVLDSVEDLDKTNQTLVQRVQLARLVVVSLVVNKTSNNRQLLVDLAQVVEASASGRITNNNNNSNNRNNNPVVSVLVVV